jgi:hypothetical protein
MHKYFRKHGGFWLERIMRKTTLQQQQIVVASRSTEVIRLLTERLRLKDQLVAAESAARKSKKKAAKRWVHCI